MRSGPGFAKIHKNVTNMSQNLHIILLRYGCITVMEKRMPSKYHPEGTPIPNDRDIIMVPYYTVPSADLFPKLVITPNDFPDISASDRKKLQHYANTMSKMTDKQLSDEQNKVSAQWEKALSKDQEKFLPISKLRMQIKNELCKSPDGGKPLNVPSMTSQIRQLHNLEAAYREPHHQVMIDYYKLNVIDDVQKQRQDIKQYMQQHAVVAHAPDDLGGLSTPSVGPAGAGKPRSIS